jgi:hypothetical protein
MGHEFVGEVVGHGPDCSGDFPLGTRVTSMPILIRAGQEPLVIGHHPDAPGAFGELMVVSEVMSRKVPDGVPNDPVAVVDAFAVGEFYVRCSGIGPGELPLVIGAGAIVANNVSPYEVVAGNPARRLRFRFDEDRIKRILSSKWWELSDETLKEIEPFLYSKDIDAFLMEVQRVKV